MSAGQQHGVENRVAPGNERWMNVVLFVLCRIGRRDFLWNPTRRRDAQQTNTAVLGEHDRAIARPCRAAEPRVDRANGYTGAPFYRHPFQIVERGKSDLLAVRREERKR